MNQNNGFHSQRPSATNGNGNGKGSSIAVQTKAVNEQPLTRLPIPQFDRPVMLRQSPVWSRAIAWTVMGVTTVTVVWACVAQTEEAIPAQGKLEPEGTVTAVQVPVDGVVKEILVRDGQRVHQGDRLISLDPTAAQAEQTSQQQIRTALMQENEYYQTQMRGLDAPRLSQLLKSLPPAQTSLTKNRAALVAENKLYRLQLSGSSGEGLMPDQQVRLQSSQLEVSSRINAARLDVDQLTKQFAEAQIKLASDRDQLAVAQKISGDMNRLFQEGGLGRVQYFQQQQEVFTHQADVGRGVQEEKRLRSAIAQSQEKLQNTISLSQTELFDKIANNEKRIAEIDSQLTKSIVENSNRIAQIDSQLSKSQLTLRYQDLKAPVSGTVFDLQAHTPGFVANSTTPILKLVPDDALVAKVFITNRDIGFVKEGMPVDVRVDSFPFSEFGDIKGKLVWIGSDALPPDQIYSFYRFPAKVRLDRQLLTINGRDISLQSGMSLSCNIKLRKRTIASIFTDLFTRKMESLKSVR